MNAAPSRGKRSPPPAVVLVLLACVLVVGVIWMATRPRRVAEVPPPAQPAPAPGTFRPTPEQWRSLGFATVSDMNFPVVEDTDGQIAQDDDVTVQVLPPFSGRVGQVFVRAGDRVRKGQPLASADASEFAQAQNDLATAAANLTAARAQLVNAEANAQRQKALLAINGAATRDVQQSQADLAAAQAAVKTDEATLAGVRNRLGILGYDPAQIAALQVRPGPSAGAQAMVRAPISGVVTQRQVGPGQYLNATSNGATTPLFTISDLSKVWLVANVREADADRMRLGLPLKVYVSALPGRSFDARVDFVAPALDPTTRRLPVHATVQDPGELLKPGMFADFSIVSAPGETAPGVPQAAVIYEGEVARVWVANPDHTLALRQIKAGRDRDGMVEALSGLRPGDRVVTTGALFIDRAARPD